MSTGQMTMGIITIVLTVIIAVAGAVWAISERINTSHAELLEESAKTRVEVEKLRGDIERLESKFDEFRDSHEREHDLFYGQGDSENPAPPN